MVRILTIMALLAGCGGGEKAEVCGNKADDDGDGLIDCADDDCIDPSCLEICDDLIDNNGNNQLDCNDPQCDGRGCEEICDDGRDNDLNGYEDCNDEACLVDCDADEDGWADGIRGGPDCNDFDEMVNPDALEVCDGIDNNCNGLVDREDPDIDPTEVTLWYLDEDGDGYGLPIDALYECEQPPGRVAQGGDCDDEDVTINPDTPEICNGLDDDCDGLIDDQDTSVDPATAFTWYLDADGDGWGDAGFTLVACTKPVGHVDNGDDCDDGNAASGAPSLWVQDTDADGFGGGTPVGPFGCTPPGPDYYPDYTSIDCNESDPLVNPGASETCGDLVDSDCDGRDCPAFKEDWESGNVGFRWDNTGNVGWTVQTGVVHAGNFAAESGDITHNETSRLTVTLDYPGGGDINFWHSGDTERSWDYFRVFVDGIQRNNWSGNWGWTNTVYVLTPGVHRIEFVYQKDGSVNTGADAVWLDDIIATGGTVQ